MIGNISSSGSERGREGGREDALARSTVAFIPPRIVLVRPFRGHSASETSVCAYTSI